MEPSANRVLAVAVVAAGAFVSGALVIGAWLVAKPSFDWPLAIGYALLAIGFFSALGVAGAPTGRPPSSLQRLDQRVVGKRTGDSVAD